MSYGHISSLFDWVYCKDDMVTFSAVTGDEDTTWEGFSEEQLTFCLLSGLFPQMKESSHRWDMKPQQWQAVF